jgi:small subunit ribosomal protein S6
VTATTDRYYETIFISPAVLTEDDVEKVISDVTDIFASRGAEVDRVERWGRKRLAYPIKKQDEGWYVLMQVKGNGDAVQEVERRLRLSEQVLKYLSVRLDDVSGALEHRVQRIERLARLEEERKVRAAERAQREEAERTTPSRDDLDDDDKDDKDDDDYGDDR